MTRVLVLAEGQTEETFFRELLAPHLWGHEVYPQVVLAATKRVKSGGFSQIPRHANCIGGELPFGRSEMAKERRMYAAWAPLAAH